MRRSCLEQKVCVLLSLLYYEYCNNDSRLGYDKIDRIGRLGQVEKGVLEGFTEGMRLGSECSVMVRELGKLYSVDGLMKSLALIFSYHLLKVMATVPCVE